MQILNVHRSPILACSFCGKQQDLAQRLIAGPRGVYICEECVAAFSKAPQELQEEQEKRCSFCGKKQSQVRHLTVGSHEVNICSEYIVLSQEVKAENQLKQNQPRSSTPSRPC